MIYDILLKLLRIPSVAFLIRPTEMKVYIVNGFKVVN